MDNILIRPQDETEYLFLINLFEKMGLNTTKLSEEELEDEALYKLMEEADQTETVSRESIMKQLKS